MLRMRRGLVLKTGRAQQPEYSNQYCIGASPRKGPHAVGASSWGQTLIFYRDNRGSRARSRYFQ